MSSILGPVWINGWTAQMVQKLGFTISKVIPNFVNVSFLSATNTASMGFYAIRRTTILGSNYVLFAYTPLSTSVIQTAPNSKGWKDGETI